MDIKLKLDNPDWIDKNARHVLAVLNKGHEKPMALFVGGCVRNAVTGRGKTDVDIATIHTPQQTTDILKDAGIKAVPTGLDHGTVTAVIGESHYEITTLRRDVETTGRHAVVAFTEDWREDAMRRDFTMNTLLGDAVSNIFDPLGCGVDDALAGQIIFVGTAAERIQEDYLRILRFFRFYAWYGAEPADREALAACQKYAAHLDTLSKERIAQEIFRIMAAPSLRETMALIQNCNVLPQIFRADSDTDMLEHLAVMQTLKDCVDIISRLIILGRFEAASLKVFTDVMTFSGRQQKRFQDSLAAFDMLRKNTALKEVIYRKGNDIACQAVLLQAAKDNADADLSICQSWQAPRLPVTGDDIMAAGVEKGPEIGRMLKALESYWIEHDFRPDRHSLLARLKTLL